jgi:hypothetical protein
MNTAKAEKRWDDLHRFAVDGTLEWMDTAINSAIRQIEEMKRQRDTFVTVCNKPTNITPVTALGWFVNRANAIEYAARSGCQSRFRTRSH